ncbi:MAG: hypothetical protein Q9219_000631 [cf. Caloplaca sp. 3 TL-2023]
MLTWILYLGLGWLLLPLSALGHPLLESAFGETATVERFEPRSRGPSSNPDNRNAAALFQDETFSLAPNADSLLSAEYKRLLTLPAPLPPRAGKSALVESTQKDGPLNASIGAYGAYRNLGKILEFDFEYPPYTSKKIISITGSMDTDTTDTSVYVEIMGYPLGDFKGNLDEGMRIDVDILVAKGFIEIRDIQGPVQDSVYLIVDLHLPFRKHLRDKWLLFKLPHHNLKSPDSSTATA